MEIRLRLEEEADYRIVEEVTREAFWNVHQPGADEHFLLHQLRTKKEFIKALDFVAIYEDAIVGNIVYVELKIKGNDGISYHILTFGPVSVLPRCQSKGIGSQLINHTISLARDIGYRAILIYGDPDYYKRFGFKVSKDYGITNKDGKYLAAMQILELYPNALQGVTGICDEGELYNVNPDEAKVFDANFPHKEKAKTLTQERFNELANKFL